MVFEELFWNLDGLIGSKWEKKKVITTSPHHKNK
jgi:hypothetical protein